jgi:hypothetical protein
MKRQIKLFICAVTIAGILLIFPQPSYGESADNLSLKDKIANSIASQDKKHYVTVTTENDLFGGGGDRNYTSGLRIGWFDLGEKPPVLTEKIQDIIPFLKANQTTSTFYSVGQNLFTPKAVTSPMQNPKDRPWAAFLYGSMGMGTLKDDHVDELEVTLGVVGPAAFGEQTQKTLHGIFNAPHPEGWRNQLKNEPGLMISWQRRWPEQIDIDVDGLFLTASPHAGATLGNIYTYGNAGFTLKFSPEHSRWDDKPLQVRPSIPGTGFFVPSESLQWEIFAGAEGRAVARNIFLDGNTFADSHSVDKKPFVADLNAGFAFTLGRARISYTAVYRTREFDGQQDASVFGGISVGYNF